MDSLSQIALGSAVAIGVMGRRTAVWKAATWGAIAGTLPDLDVVIDHGDALLNMVLHRAESHALFWLTLFAPLMAWVVSRIHREAHLFRRWWLSLWLVLITHPLLDAMTIYGTQLLLPFTNHPYGVGSMFIIDPAYTLPLIVGVVAALRIKDATRGLHWNAVGLLISTAYLAWSALAQAHVEQQARDSLREQGVAAERVLVTPAPFQTLLWRVVALPDDAFRPGTVGRRGLGARDTGERTATGGAGTALDRPAHVGAGRGAALAGGGQAISRVKETISTPMARLTLTQVRIDASAAPPAGQSCAATALSRRL